MFDLMPFGYERSLLDSFDNFEKEFFKGMNRSLASFRTDIQDKGDHYVLEAELPGFAKEDIHIDLDDNYLTIRAEHKEEKENKDEKKAFVRQERYYGAYERRFDVTGIEVDAIKAGYENGVLGGVVSALNIFCSRGDNVLLHSPTYIGFTYSLENNGYNIVHSPLVKDENNVWRMDFEDMEKKIVDNRVHAAVFCSPHNPCGRVWERWELERAMELYKKHDVMVVSDEIWSDIILGGHRHIPTQSVSEDARSRTVAVYAPSKTFNLAGLVGSYHIIYNPVLRDRVEKEASLSHYNSMNVLSMHALLGAYR